MTGRCLNRKLTIYAIHLSHRTYTGIEFAWMKKPQEKLCTVNLHKLSKSIYHSRESTHERLPTNVAIEKSRDTPTQTTAKVTEMS